MVMVLHKFFDMDENGKLLPGYADETGTWVLKPDVITVGYAEAAYNSSIRLSKMAEKALLEEMPKTPDGWVRDTCGNAWVEINRPNRKLLNILKNLGAVRKGCHRGQWIFNTHIVQEQSITIHEKAAKAAKIALDYAFPGEEIHVHSWVD